VEIHIPQHHLIIVVAYVYVLIVYQHSGYSCLYGVMLVFLPARVVTLGKFGSEILYA
jgi:F0F1-type ATP synthase assembly protein I